MNSVEITEENARDFESLMGESLCEDMKREFFRGKGLFDDDETPVGAMVYELKNSESERDTESEIRFISPDPDTAMELFDEYDFDLSDEDIKLTRIETEEEDLAEVLEDVGFSVEKTESQKLSLGMDRIGAIPGLNKTRLPKYIISLSDISVTQYRTMIKTCYFKGHGGALEDLPYLPKEQFEGDVSACSVADGKVDGMLLVKKLGDNQLQVVLFSAFGPEYKKNLPLMMIYSARKALELYPPDTKVIIGRRNESVAALTARLFPDCHGMEVYVGKREE